jgi:tetratricopeptide (TPR) repeat protein
MLRSISICSGSALLLLLGACTTQERQTVYSGTPAPVEATSPPQDDGSAAAFARSMMLADILYAARSAHEDNRLMSPAGDNAYDRYIEVLQLDPGNEVALQGIRDIVLRYIELADGATALGKFAEAASLLQRAASLDPDREELAAARARLEVAERNKIETHALDPEGLSTQSLEMLTSLGEIAQRIMRDEATFLINARSDEEGRWIYKVMRESVGGYRLRGNIDISGTPNILITVPATGSACTTNC